MSHTFMRRFAFVYLDVPEKFDKLIARAKPRCARAIFKIVKVCPSTRTQLVPFSRTHPMLRRAAHTDSALSPVENAELLDMGAAFIAGQIHGDGPGEPTQRARWVADVFARLFLTYIATPPTDPDFGDDAELRRFATEVLTPMVERVEHPPTSMT